MSAASFCWAEVWPGPVSPQQMEGALQGRTRQCMQVLWRLEGPGYQALHVPLSTAWHWPLGSAPLQGC